MPDEETEYTGVPGGLGNVLEIYEDLLQTIWDRIQPTLGRVTVRAIMERTLVLTRERYPLVAHLQVSSEGLIFDALRQNGNVEEQDLVREALDDVVANLIDILSMLTGDILVRQLMQEIERSANSPAVLPGWIASSMAVFPSCPSA